MDASVSIVSLKQAAVAVTTALTAANRKHAFIGGYAVYTLGGGRTTQDVDVLINEPGIEIRNLLLAAGDRFYLSKTNKLRYIPFAGDSSVDIELLQGGADLPLKLPDVSTAPVLLVDEEFGETQVPILAPRLLPITKVKRWRFIADSTRPASQQRAEADRHDIGAILRWLMEHGEIIDLDEYGVKPKSELIPGFRELYHKCPELQEPLCKVLVEEDREYVMQPLE